MIHLNAGETLGCNDCWWKRNGSVGRASESLAAVEGFCKAPPVAEEPIRLE